VLSTTQQTTLFSRVTGDGLGFEGNATEVTGATEAMEKDAAVLVSTLRHWPYIAIHITESNDYRAVLNGLTIYQLSGGGALPGLTNGQKPTLWLC
jgi:hypothetical protein